MVLSNTTASTWAQRNPNRSRIQIRQRHRSRRIDKAALQLIRAKTSARHVSLLTDLKSYLEQNEVRLGELATKHNRKVQYLKKLMNTSRAYKRLRKPNLMNAIMHYKAEELNKGIERGQRLKMTEIREAAKKDPALNPETMSESRKRELIDKLLKHRAGQRHGVRVSNLAAAQDIAHTVRRVEQTMSSLADRTGNYSFAFFTRGHLDDTSMPEWIATPGVEKFMVDILKMHPDDMVRAFEHWGVLQGKNAEERDTNASLRVEVTKLISTDAITGRRTVSMSYANYDIDIRHRHQVEIIGWPPHVPFTSPSHLSTSTTLRALRDALKSGLCRWIALTKESREELAKRVENGDVAKKPRATRADKGTKRRPSGKENRPPADSHKSSASSRVARKLVKRLPPISPEMVFEDDED